MERTFKDVEIVCHTIKCSYSIPNIWIAIISVLRT
jgi:hypothetical protein